MATPTPPTMRAVKPDEGQELGEPFDITLELRGGVGARARLEPGFGQALLQILGEAGQRGVVVRAARQRHAIGPAHEAAGLQQAGRAQAVLLTA